MRLYLCEKPSQGKDIAKVLGATKRGEGCLVGNDVTVTWCIGHLLETAPPETYDPAYKKWALEHLPIAPPHWKMLIKPQTSAQFKIVKKLLGEATELIIATDADREGEMIARELIDYCGYKGRVFRLWLSALNDASIRKALGELKPGTETISLYYSALTRSRCDWLVGMNLSRLFTLLGRQSGYDGVLSVGRVQTPTLNLVVTRDREIAKFVPVPYWAIDVALKTGNADATEFIAQWQPPDDSTDEAGRCIMNTVAHAAVNAIKQAKTAQVTSVQTERVKETHPLLFDLGTLQEVCSHKFGLGAQETLDIAQALYETHKATTYPRSDCGYLPDSMYVEVPTVFNALVKTDPTIGHVIGKLDTSIKSRVWNDQKVTAHHGIIPTLEPAHLAAVSQKELAVYKLIRSYFLAQFLPFHEYDRTVAEFLCGGQPLKATGKQIIVMGWRSVLRDDAANGEGREEQESKSQVLPRLSQGIPCEVGDAEIKALKTLPPRPYTEGELIKSMKGIARLVTDRRLKQILKETTGIGTEATRAGIIKGLLQRGFLVPQGKAVRAADAAFTLIDAVPPAIIDPGTTALWEQALESIEKGEMTMEVFLSKQVTWLTQLIEQYGKTRLNVKPAATPPCPLCGSPLKKRTGKNGTFWSCSRYPVCKGVQNIGTKTGKKPGRSKTVKPAS